jgi:hypothetical protein
MSKELDDLLRDFLCNRPKTEREILRGERAPPPEFIKWIADAERRILQGV